MTKSQDTLMETETTIRWDETDAPAYLFTASSQVRKGWESYGYIPKKHPHGGWFLNMPKDRIIFKIVKK